MLIIAIVSHCVQTSPDTFAMMKSSLKCDEETHIADLYRWINSDIFNFSRPKLSEIVLTIPIEL